MDNFQKSSINPKSQVNADILHLTKPFEFVKKRDDVCQDEPQIEITHL